MQTECFRNDHLPGKTTFSWHLGWLFQTGLTVLQSLMKSKLPTYQITALSIYWYIQSLSSYFLDAQILLFWFSVILVIFCIYGFRTSANRVRASDTQIHLPKGQVGIFNFVEHWHTRDTHTHSYTYNISRLLYWRELCTLQMPWCCQWLMMPMRWWCRVVSK